jgi:transposase
MEAFWSTSRRASPLISCQTARLTRSCAFLKRHQEIEIVSRDRASAYADATKRALPHATQVADRYHLVHNLRQHLQQFLDRKRTWLPEIEDSPLQALSSDDRDLANALETQSSVTTSHPSPSTASAPSTDQPQAQVQSDLPHGQRGEQMERASLTYAERKKKISRDKRYAR